MTRRIHATAALVVAVAAASSCRPSVNTLQVTVEAYISAVSLGDFARIMDLSAPYQREAASTVDEAALQALRSRFRGTVEVGYMRWDQAKSTGELQLDELGVALIRGIGLGKEGAAAMPLRVRFEADNTRGIVTTRAITNYEGIPWGRIPSGRMYLMGTPFGRVINFAVGYDDPSVFELLATVDLEWTLVRLTDIRQPVRTPGDWFVEGVRPLPGTETAWSPPPGP